MLADLLLPVCRHHAAVLQVIVAAPVETLPFKPKVEFAGHCIEDTQSFGNHFFANAVAGDYRDPVFLHCSSNFKRTLGRRTYARLTSVRARSLVVPERPSGRGSKS